MKRSFNPASVPAAIALESVQVASPCHADWNAMHGDDRSRFCPSCAKNVYNLSAMTRGEAETLLQEKEGRLCVRYYLREDGTMLTQDCPVGVAALKERSPSFALWAGVASMLVLVGALLSPSFMIGAHAQPEPQSGETPTQTATPEATPLPCQPELPVRMDDFAAAPSPTIAPASTPTPAPTEEPASYATLGEVSVAPAPHGVPHATPKPEQLTPLMGKPSVPVPTATPRPQAPRPTMGRIAVRHTSPTPVPPPKDVPPPLMGAIALPAKPAVPPAKKTSVAPKKRKPSSTPRR